MGSRGGLAAVGRPCLAAGPLTRRAGQSGWRRRTACWCRWRWRRRHRWTRLRASRRGTCTPRGSRPEVEDSRTTARGLDAGGQTAGAAQDAETRHRRAAALRAPCIPRHAPLPPAHAHLRGGVQPAVPRALQPHGELLQHRAVGQAQEGAGGGAVAAGARGQPHRGVVGGQDGRACSSGGTCEGEQERKGSGCGDAREAAWQ